MDSSDPHTTTLLSPIQKIHRHKVAREAAKVGVLTRLSERVTEAIAMEAKPSDQEWSRKTGLDLSLIHI